MRRSDSLPSFPPRFGQREAVPSLVPLVRSHSAPGTGTGGLENLVTVSGPPILSVETARPPRFLGDPVVDMPCSRDPGETSTPSCHVSVSVLPSAKGTTSALTNLLSGLNHTACPLAVYASQPGSPPDHARLASGWWLAFAGQDWLPAGSQRKVSTTRTACHPPFPSFPCTPLFKKRGASSSIGITRRRAGSSSFLFSGLGISLILQNRD